MKRKNIRNISCFVLCIIFFTGCTSDHGTNEKINKQNSVKKIIKEQMATKAPSINSTQDNAGKRKDSKNKDKKYVKERNTSKQQKKDVQVDLVHMNSDMIYATVYQMMADPKSYEGKNIRMKGNYDSVYDKKTKKTYHYCIIQDALACCAQGMEFECTNKKISYPKKNTIVIVTGKFVRYKEKGDKNVYCKLANAVISLKKK